MTATGWFTGLCSGLPHKDPVTRSSIMWSNLRPIYFKRAENYQMIVETDTESFLIWLKLSKSASIAYLYSQFGNQTLHF